MFTALRRYKKNRVAEFSLSPTKRLCSLNNVLLTYDESLRVEGNHYHRILQILHAPSIK
jgi:hypothetical protein